jgi:hypothetical protein
MKRKVRSNGQSWMLKPQRHRKRKLADAEAALKKAKEEAQQVSAELERAKAEAQNARESEAAVAARAKAEQAYHSTNTRRPGIGGRLRRWLGRPETPKP